MITSETDINAEFENFRLFLYIFFFKEIKSWLISFHFGPSKWETPPSKLS